MACQKNGVDAVFSFHDINMVEEESQSKTGVIVSGVIVTLVLVVLFIVGANLYYNKRL